MEWGTRRPDGGHPVLGLRVRGTAGPRTTSPGGQLVLGPHVRGDSWSSDKWHQFSAKSELGTTGLVIAIINASHKIRQSYTCLYVFYSNNNSACDRTRALVMYYMPIYIAYMC